MKVLGVGKLHRQNKGENMGRRVWVWIFAGILLLAALAVTAAIAYMTLFM